MIGLYDSIVDLYITFSKAHWGYIQKYVLKLAQKRAEEMNGQGNVPLKFIKGKAEELVNFKLQITSTGISLD